MQHLQKNIAARSIKSLTVTPAVWLRILAGPGARLWSAERDCVMNGCVWKRHWE